jgi:hypothetical protein
MRFSFNVFKIYVYFLPFWTELDLSLGDLSFWWLLSFFLFDFDLDLLDLINFFYLVKVLSLLSSVRILDFCLFVSDPLKRMSFSPCLGIKLS